MSNIHFFRKVCKNNYVTGHVYSAVCLCKHNQTLSIIKSNIIVYLDIPKDFFRVILISFLSPFHNFFSLPLYRKCFSMKPLSLFCIISILFLGNTYPILTFLFYSFINEALMDCMTYDRWLGSIFILVVLIFYNYRGVMR